MKNYQRVALLLWTTLFFTISGCRKTIEENTESSIPAESTLMAPPPASYSSGTCVEDEEIANAYDSILQPTILGYHLVNHPYSLSSMRQAYVNLTGNSTGVEVTNIYARFKPSTPQQLAVLEDLDIDLYDYPLDYDVQQEGEYYNDGVTPAESIPWLYAVTELNFVPPAGIQYEELERIHVPTLSTIENEAFRITGNPTDYSDCGVEALASPQESPASKPPVIARIPLCPDDQHWDYATSQCVPNNCAVGFYWNGTACVPIPPQSPSASRTPSGSLTVFDTNLGGANAHRFLRNVRVVGRRFLKVQRTFTNNQGQFNFSKEFNKVTLLVKFKNDQANIRALRRARLWQMLFPVKLKLGKFKGNLNNLTREIDYNNNALSRGARYWAAATAHNSVQEYYDYAAQLTVGTPPAKIKVLLTNWRLQGTTGATPMFAKRVWQELPSALVTTFVISQINLVAGGLTGLTNVLKAQVDVTLGYNDKAAGVNITANSARISEVAFHELTHAAHYNKVGNNWWKDFVDAEIHEMTGGGPSPYGNGTSGIYSPIIALGESWAYHAGHFLADRKYGVNSPSFFEQGFEYRNGDIRQGGIVVANTGLNAHLNLLEDFNPLRTAADPFFWIPQGLYYDLIDNRNDNAIAFPRVPLNDVVIGYTNQQFFNALDSDIKALVAYRTRLLNESANNQIVGVTNIFDFYGY